MKVLNEVKMVVESRSQNEGFVRLSASGFFAQTDPDIGEISEIKTAISEAVTNCIVHGYKNEIGKIFITMRILEDNSIYIKIRDNGCGIENVKQAMEPLFTTAKEDERAGLGFAVMQTFTDNLKVYSQLGRGTTVVMQKNIKRRVKND